MTPKIKEIPISFHRYKSAKSIVCNWFNCKDTSKEVKLFTFTDAKETGTIQMAIDIVKIRKCWGFCRHDKNLKSSEIHFWVHKDCNLFRIVNMFAHEIAHASGYRNETSAVKIGAICEFTTLAIAKTFKNKMKLSSMEFEK